MKMDLALNNLQRLICHKTKQTKQTSPVNNKLEKTYVRSLFSITDLTEKLVNE